MEDVLVVGAGPVGLTMAAELARHGVRSRVIDRLATPSSYCRAIGVTPRTLEVWDDMGITRPMIDAGLWLSGMRSLVSDSPPQDIRLDLTDLPYGHLGIPQYETERILGQHLTSLGIKVERPVELISLRQCADSIDVQLNLPDGRTQNATFRYVVGCDGAHSVVRKSLGIAFEGDRFPVQFMLGDVLMDLGLPRGMSLRAVHPVEDGPPDFFVAIPLPQPNRYRVSMLAPEQPSGDLDLSNGHGLQAERPAPGIAALQEVANRLLPEKPQLSDLRWSSLFLISMRLASRYRVGNAFIAGDAAHIHPPTGGQGMNTGIQDAYNLAWKLALVLKGAAAPALLDSYEAERRPVGADVVSRTRAQSEKLGRERPKPEDRLADTQILINYRGFDWVKDEVSDALAAADLRAGDRAPDCTGLRRENINFPLRLFDVIRGTEHVLLVYIAGDSAPECKAFLESLAMHNAIRDPGIRIVAVAAPGTQVPEITGIALFEDREGRFAQVYKASSGTAYLVRPDGYISYRANPITEIGLMRYLRKAGFLLDRMTGQALWLPS
jgi:2-polyprenyl-6-methoxyphenol hydroxylase-like FAD-dependent oxidoreductase